MSRIGKTNRPPKRPPYKPVKCPVAGCGFVPVSWVRHERHRMMHSGEKPFACHFSGCSFRTNQYGTLYMHKKAVHLNIRPLACHVAGCTHRCPQKSTLRAHVWTHIEKGHEIVGCQHCEALILDYSPPNRTETVEQALVKRRDAQRRKLKQDKQRERRLGLAARGEVVELVDKDSVDDDAEAAKPAVRRLTVAQAMALREIDRQKNIDRRRRMRERNRVLRAASHQVRPVPQHKRSETSESLAVVSANSGQTASGEPEKDLTAEDEILEQDDEDEVPLIL